MTDNLLELIDSGDIDSIMEIVTPKEIARAWCRYHARDQQRGELDPDWWAVELWLNENWWERGDLVRAGLLLLIEEAQERELLDAVAAGPLENFISADEEDLRWLEEQADRVPRFREALCKVFIWEMPRAVFERVERAARSALPRPGNDHN